MILVYDNISNTVYTVIGFCYDKEKKEFRSKWQSYADVQVVPNCESKIDVQGSCIVITLEEVKVK